MMFFFLGWWLLSAVSEECVIERVVDGDTLEVRIGYFRVEKVRLARVDAPERRGRKKSPGGEEAYLFMREIAEGKKALLFRDPNQPDRDVYCRLVRFVYLPEVGVWLGRALKENGYGKPAAVIISNGRSRKWENSSIAI